MSAAQRIWIPALLVTALALPALAQPQEAEESVYDRIWAKTQLYRGDDDSFFQSLDFSGRLQLDFAYVDSDDDDHGEFNVRRFRVGFKTIFGKHFTLHTEADFNPQEAEPVYTALTDFYLSWSRAAPLRLTLGKQSASFTLEGMTSSKRLLTIDRSNLANNIWFTTEYIPGFSLQGKKSGWVYFAGVFSSGDDTPQFGDFTGGQFVLFTLGYDFADRLPAEEALLRANYVDNEPDPDNGFTRPLEQILSLNFSYRAERWGFQTDFSAATGYFEQSDLWGLVLMPYRELGARSEIVARYTLVESDEPNGVRFARYERTIADGLGDRYDEIFLGLNYYWYGHKLKMQHGLQYVEMEDRADDGGAYSGWGWTSALRIYW